MFNLDVEEYIRDLEWSDTTYDHEKTIVADSLRALYRRLEDETRGLKSAVDRWAIERALDDGDFGERLLLAEWFKLNPDSLTLRESCECGGECDECPTRADVDAFVERVMREKVRVERVEADFIRQLKLERR